MQTRASILSLLLVAGCASAPPRLPAERADAPAGVLHLRWRTAVHTRPLFEMARGECATGTVVGGRLVIGSRANAIVGIDTALGGVAWKTPVSGGIDSAAVYDGGRRVVYVGADDGQLHAVDPASGALRWSAKVRGAVERPPAIADDAIYVATAANRVFAVDAQDGKQRWQYDRETPEGFAIHGYSAPVLKGDNLLAGFADGYVVSLNRKSGEVVWARSLAGASEHFVDVDSTPTLLGDTVFAASYSGGLFALSAIDGAQKWRAGIEGVGSVRVVGDALYFTAPREGLHAMDPEGHILWRQGMGGAGDLTTPTAFGPYLVFSGSDSGMIIVERATGRLVQVFNPGSGVCGGPAIDEANRRIYVLGNAGSVYGFDVDVPGA